MSSVPDELLASISKRAANRVLDLAKKKPVMKNRPTWARYLCRDDNGVHRWHEAKPRYNKRMGVWTSKGQCELAVDINDALTKLEHTEGSRW